jgi:tetratricopeptide (TPR) repeat protein
VRQGAWFLTLYIACWLPCYSQFLPNLQARTAAEYDAYLDVLDGPVLKYGTAFEREFPQSSLRLPVCELIAREWRVQGQREEAIAAAERGLSVAPDYIPLLVELADLLSNGSERLDRAAQAANQALELLDRVKAPLRIAPDDWSAAVAKLRARAHSALAMVLFKKGDHDGAVKEFKAALAPGGADDLTVHYRLGRLYAVKGKVTEARQELERAALSPDPVLRDMAKKALDELQ